MKDLIKKIFQSIYAVWQKYLGEWSLARQFSRSKDDFQWRRGTPCPKRRVEGNGVVLGEKLYLFGGYETIAHVLDRCDVFDFQKNQWVDYIETPKEMAQTHVGLTTDGRYIYILGGQSGPHCSPCTDRCFVFDTQTKTFSQFPSLPQPRYVGVAQYWNGRVHVVGGSLQDRFSPGADHWSIEVHEGRAVGGWREEVRIPRGGMHRGSAIVGNTLYLIGGCEGDVQPVAGDPQFKCNWRTPMEHIHGEVYKLESGAKEWKRLADMPLKLGHTDTTVVAMDNHILVFGGTETRIKCSNLIWRYDIAQDRWEKIGSLPYHMKSTYAHYFDGRFYLLAGQRSRSSVDLRPYPTPQARVWIAEASPWKSPRRKRIGVMPIGGNNWIAGVNYLQNIVRATNVLPPEERPELFFMCHYKENTVQLAKHFGLKRSDFHRFAFQTTDGRKAKLAAIVACLLRGIWPRSLKALVRALQIDAFAPMLDMVGKEIEVPWIGWIPDFQHKSLPDFFPAEELQKRDKYFRNLVDQADHVIVSSQDAYQGLMKWFPTQKEKVSVFHYPFLTEPAWYAGDARSVASKFHLPEKFLMFPGQFWVHKNHQTLFEAIRILVKDKGNKDIVLVCSGRQHDYRFPEHFAKVKKFIEANGLEQHIRLLGLIDRQDQIQLMRACAAIVQPSFFEGWCLMIEEARSLGKRIFLSDLDVHREQDPPHAIYFDPHDAKGLADLLERNWAGLKAGVDPQAEAQARMISAQMDIDFGRRFNAIVDKTLRREVISCR